MKMKILITLLLLLSGQFTLATNNTTGNITEIIESSSPAFLQNNKTVRENTADESRVPALSYSESYEKSAPIKQHSTKSQSEQDIKLFSFNVPLEVKGDGEEVPSHSPEYEEMDDNNAERYNVESPKERFLFVKNQSQTSQLQEGSGFHQVAHQHQFNVIQQPNEIFPYNGQIELGPGDIEIQPVVSDIKYLDYPISIPFSPNPYKQQDFIVPKGPGVKPLPIVEKHLHLLPPKPLKPSIVHRDPHDYYNPHDKLRTQDKDKSQLHKTHQYEDEGSKFQIDGYDMKKLPECAFKNKHFYNLTFCLEDHLYPLEAILWALQQQGQLTHKLLSSDVTYQSADNLVTGLTKEEEEGYTYKHYFGANHAKHVNLEQYKPPYRGYTYKVDYYKHGGFVCPSDIFYARIKRAMNTFGKWKVIVNVDQVPQHIYYRDGLLKKREAYFDQNIEQKSFTQTIRIEQCVYQNAPCSYINPIFHSRCIQKHNFVRLVAWTLEDGLHVDTFKIPIACSCHIPQPIHFFQESGHREETEGRSNI